MAPLSLTAKSMYPSGSAVLYLLKFFEKQLCFEMTRALQQRADSRHSERLVVEALDGAPPARGVGGNNAHARPSRACNTTERDKMPAPDKQPHHAPSS